MKIRIGNDNIWQQRICGRFWCANPWSPVLKCMKSNPKLRTIQRLGVHLFNNKILQLKFQQNLKKKKTYGFCLYFQIVVKTTYVFLSRNIVFCVVVKIHLNRTSNKHQSMEFSTPLPMKCKSRQSWFNSKKDL